MFIQKPFQSHLQCEIHCHCQHYGSKPRCYPHRNQPVDVMLSIYRLSFCVLYQCRNHLHQTNKFQFLKVNTKSSNYLISNVYISKSFVLLPCLDAPGPLLSLNLFLIAAMEMAPSSSDSCSSR